VESLRLHHIGVVVGDIDRSTLLYAERMNYVVRTDVIHDARQTAHVRFLSQPGEAVYLELVAPDGPASKLSNALMRGGGLNHVCYSTENIDDACRELRAQGMHLIQSPQPAVAFNGRRIAWLMAPNRVVTELVERGADGDL
jgi:methylmalonyl-CoA/ethylmalonyl-CoA epimerase